MIYLKKGQTLFDNPGMIVYDPTGYYDDGTSVICAPIFAPEEPTCRYEAKYIAYGGMVYSISNEEELLKQIQELDPQTLFGKDSKQVAIDKVAEDIITQGTSQVTEKNSEIKEEEPRQVEKTPTTTAPEDILSSDTSTTTSPTINPSTTPATETTQTSETSTTTPAVDIPPTTTAPEDLLPVDDTVLPLDIPSVEIIPEEDIASSTLTQ